MAGNLLTVMSQMQCPHGGKVMATSGNTKVMDATGAALLLMTDTCTIAGCPFQVPVPGGTKPQPCVTVKWISGEASVLVNNTPALSDSSVGYCFSAENILQGTVVINGTQAKIASQ